VKGFHDLRHYPGARTPPGLVLLRFGGPLTFFNASYFKERVLAAADAAGPDLRAVVVDATTFSTREDATAVLTLVELSELLRARGVALALAGKRHLMEEWRRSRGLDADVETPRVVKLFSTLEDAVEALAVVPERDGALRAP
jgi:MFS superfamily sulfate permease-like transporter